MPSKEIPAVKIKDRTRKEHLQYVFNRLKNTKKLPNNFNSLPLMIRLANEDQIIQLGDNKVEISEEERTTLTEELNQFINIPEYAESLASALKISTLPDLLHT